MTTRMGKGDAVAALVSLGSINADFQVRVDEPPTGSGSSLGRDLLRTGGGKAANVAVLARRLGVSEVVLLGCVGDDDLAAQALRGPVGEGLDVGRVRRRPGATAYSSILVPPGGEKTIVLVPGANDAWGDDVAGVASDVRAAPDGSVLVVDLEVPGSLVRAALEAARERALTTVLDPAPPARFGDVLLTMVDHVVPDHAEASSLTGIDAWSDSGACAAAEALVARGARVAHVKLAEGGCAVAGSFGTVVVEAPEVEVVDATGAGDAFAGGLGWALLQGWDPVEATRAGVAASNCAVAGWGSQESYPALPALEAMLARVAVRS